MSPDPSGPQSTGEPRVSVVIPARATPVLIISAIESALRQENPTVIEVVIAAADGPTAAAARSVDDPRVVVVDNPDGSTPVGLNLAVKATTGELIVRCDAHSVLPPGYVTEAVSALSDPDVVNVGGRQLARGVTLFERAVALAMSSPIGAGDARYRIGGASGPVDTVYLGVFRRSALEAVGGFDETLERNQDYELNWRLRQAGGVVWFDNDLAVDYRPRGSLRSLWTQYFQYGRWKRLVLGRHPESLKWRQLAPPALLAGLAVSPVAAALDARLGLVVPGVYLALTIAAGAIDLVRTRDLAAVAEPPALWAMHLAWGLGFILGPPRGRR